MKFCVSFRFFISSHAIYENIHHNSHKLHVANEYVCSIYLHMVQHMRVLCFTISYGVKDTLRMIYIYYSICLVHYQFISGVRSRSSRASY